MADKTLSSLAGGGGLGLRITELVKGTIASGVTGDILVATAPNNNSVVRLFLLACSTTISQSGISVIVDGNTLEDQKVLIENSGNTSLTNFGVTRGSANATLSHNLGRYSTISGKSITINKNAGNTTQAINYAYEILEPIV